MQHPHRIAARNRAADPELVAVDRLSLADE
jgi:hypothetical protein